MKRSELYEAIWSEPTIKVAKRVGCSDTWLREICRRHGIPLPPRGYWGRVHGNNLLLRASLLVGEDVDVGLRLSVGPPREEKAPAYAQNQDALQGGDGIAPAAAVERLVLRRDKATSGRGGAHRIAHIRQLYRDAKAWRRQREVNDFLFVVASNAEQLDSQSRAVALCWIASVRADLERTDPLIACLKRVIM